MAIEASIRTVGPLVIIQLNYKFAGPLSDDGAEAIGISFEYFYDDHPVTLNAGGFSGEPGRLQTTNTRFFYYADKNEVQMVVTGIGFNLGGNWQINLPVPSN